MPKPQPKLEQPTRHQILSPRQQADRLANDLEECPRCGLRIQQIIWGKTDCPNCGLHFECC